jgi:hypothetical protein
MRVRWHSDFPAGESGGSDEGQTHSKSMDVATGFKFARTLLLGLDYGLSREPPLSNASLDRAKCRIGFGTRKLGVIHRLRQDRGSL